MLPGRTHTILSQLNLSVCFLTVVLATTLQAQDTPSPAGLYPTQLWAAGNASGIYVTWSRQGERDLEFQIFYRKTSDDQFQEFPWYIGAPTTVAAGDYRLLVFLTDGISRSYALGSAMRTEKPLPPDFEAVDCTMQQGNVFVLARAQKNTMFTLTPSIGDPNIDPEVLAEISVAAYDYFVFHREINQSYQSLTTEPLPIKLWNRPKLVLHADDIHLFGIVKEDSSEGFTSGSLAQRQWTGENWSETEIIPIKNVVDLTALVINHQIRIVAFVQSDDAPDDSASGLLSAVHFHLVWPTEQGWHITEPLQEEDTAPLAALPDEIAFAVLDQNLAVFQRHSSEEIHGGIYDVNGQNIQTVTLAISTGEEQGYLLLIWFNIGLMVVIALVILYWRRADAFSDTSVLPKHIQLAPLTYRLLAFFLDILPALLITIVLFPDAIEEPATQVSFWQQIQDSMTATDPATFKMEATFLGMVTVYMMIAEVLLATTPGKIALRLVVLNRSGAAVTPKQAIIRNLLRLVELQILFIALLVLFTVRRQRIGDLAARTMVVVQNPELMDRLNHSPSSALASDKSDETDDSQDEEGDSYNRSED